MINVTYVTYKTYVNYLFEPKPGSSPKPNRVMLLPKLNQITTARYLYVIL